MKPALLAALLGLGLLATHVAAETETRPSVGPGLTPIGAEQAGNAAGTIPPWTGGITEVPAGYRPGVFHPDPYPEDPVLFNITAVNVDEHAARLSEGQIAMLRAYPESWRMPVYRSRRSASFPNFVYQAVVENASRSVLITEGKGGVRESRIGSPFPVPKRGVEVIWNHTLRWRGIYIELSNGTAAVTRRGNYRVTLSAQQIGIPYGSPKPTAFKREYPNVMFALKGKVIQPALLAGNGTLAIEPIDQTKDPRKVWIYSPALRRVLRLPHFAYDFPAPNSDNLRTIDDLDLFLGAPDRFEWKILGKRELYIPYNAYRLHSGELTPSDVLRQSHIEPSLARYELHRVWVVEGTLKPGERHVYSRRVFFVDEDSWQIAVSDQYDLDGKLWRVSEAHALNYYEVPTLWHTLLTYQDLDRRRYLVSGLDNERTAPVFADGADPREFSPNALTYYIR
jgi:hypothetical protein